MDRGIATRLRRAGLAVREIDGWKDHSNGFDLAPKGGVMHHTAGHPSKSGPIPSLDILIHGRADLSGPLCNVALGFNGVFYVIAAGSANHAGTPDGGIKKGMDSNGDAYGMEIEHDGTHPLSDRMTLLAARGFAALFQRDDIPASQLVQHWEWAPSRKIDLATNMHPGADPTNNEFRALLKREIIRLRPVHEYRIAYLRRSDLKKVTVKVNHPDVWCENHDAALERGQVTITPLHK